MCLNFHIEELQLGVKYSWGDEDGQKALVKLDSLLDVLREFRMETLKAEEKALNGNTAMDVADIRSDYDTRTYIVKTGNKIIGTATLWLEQKYINNLGLVAHIEDFVVANGYKKRGLGSSLIRHIVSVAKELGCYKVVLTCNDKHKGYYEYLGFAQSNIEMRLDLTS